MELEQVRRYPGFVPGPAMSGILRALERIETGSLLVLHGEAEWLLKGGNPGPQATLEVRRPLSMQYRILVSGAVGLAESYIRGDWDSPNTAEALALLGRNERALTAQDRPLAVMNGLNRLRHGLNRNSLRGSRRNIAAHYDLGNDFYRLWLDPGMTYSSALFGDDAQDLETAQHRKYQRLIDLLDPRPKQHVLEIGCGWGGFALEAARRGLKVTGVTLSREQLDLARARVREAGLEDSVELRLQDYRELEGTFDHIVSIEMFEAVGEDNWKTYADTLRRCLKPDGRAALQFIAIDESVFEQYRNTPDFIQRYIFPGGMLPSRERFRDIAQAAGLRLAREDCFGQDYARTLSDWHQRFLRCEEAVAAMGFGERFRRMWRYYLAYCEAGFRTRRIDLAQVLIEHA